MPSGMMNSKVFYFVLDCVSPSGCLSKVELPYCWPTESNLDPAPSIASAALVAGCCDGWMLLYFPASASCPASGGRAVEWEAGSGTGQSMESSQGKIGNGAGLQVVEVVSGMPAWWSMMAWWGKLRTMACIACNLAHKMCSSLLSTRRVVLIERNHWCFKLLK